MSSTNCNAGAIPAGESSKAIVLRIIGLSVPAFKNRKRAIVNKATGKLRTLTDPRVKNQMEEIIQGIESQLLFFMPINGEGTLTGQQVHSWIASNLPADDSRQWMPELHIHSRSCDKGEEGAEIRIEKL